MTQQVRTAYRKHQADAGVRAARGRSDRGGADPDRGRCARQDVHAAIPGVQAVTPAGVTGSTTSQTVCADNSSTVKLELKNTAKTVNLGSANVTFPTSVTLTGTPTVTGGSAAQSASRVGSVVRLRDLVLPKFGVATVTVTLDAGSADQGSRSRHS